MNLVVCIGVLLPFPFYCWLWKFPQSWVDLCGKDTDPCHRMAQVSHIFKILQFLALFSVAHFCWPPWYSWVLFIAGQYLNFRYIPLEIFWWYNSCGAILSSEVEKTTYLLKRVYQLLGESGTYYGIRFGKDIPWVTEFPFGYIKDPQYVGSILSLFACLCWVPFQYILLWSLGYVFMMVIESKEDPATRVKPLS